MEAITHTIPAAGREVTIRDLTWIDMKDTASDPSKRSPLAMVRRLLRAVNGEPWPGDGRDRFDVDKTPLPDPPAAMLIASSFVGTLVDLSDGEALDASASQQPTADGVMVRVRGKMVEIKQPTTAELERAMEVSKSLDSAMYWMTDWSIKSIDGVPVTHSKPARLDVASMHFIKSIVSSMIFPTEEQTNAAHKAVRSGASAA